LTDPYSIEGRVVVVTGGLGQLGAQYGASLLRAGATVVLLDQVSHVQLPGPLSGAEHHPSLMTVRADVTSREELASALDQVIASVGPPQGLVNNAALDSPPDSPATENGPFEDYPESSLDEILAVNIKGTFLASQVFGGQMAKQGDGSIINICSIYGLVSPDQRLYADRRTRGEIFFKPAAYAVSKSALLNLTRYLATYWAPSGVRVNTLSLGGVERDQSSDFRLAYSQRVPLGRMAREDEYNGAVRFLLSDASSYMTGANLVIDGGWTAW